jgi:flagellar protein FliS
VVCGAEYGGRVLSKNPYESYHENKILSASQEELTLMLYDGGIKFCNLAIAAIEKKDIEKAHTNITKAQNIITEFRLTLNHNYAISQEFDKLYEYMFTRLTAANMEKNAEIVTEVLGMFRDFRDTWAEAMKLAKGSNVPRTDDLVRKI